MSEDMMDDKPTAFWSVMTSRDGLVGGVAGSIYGTAKRIRAHVKESMSKSSDQLLVSLLMILVGVFYMATLGPGHNWGGDFSQYILHARNIALGRPYDQIGYIYCPYNPELGPSVYPPGFPILLSPVYRVFGLSFAAFKIEGIVFLLLSLAVLWFLFRDHLSTGYRTALLGLFAFSPWMVSFKENVLADIPFLFFIYLSFLCISLAYKRGDFRFGFAALLIVLIWFSSLVRTPGVLLIPALLAYDVYQNKHFSRFSILVALSSTALILAGRFFFPGEVTYIDQMRHWNPYIIVNNLIDYAKAVSLFWPQMTPSPYSTVPIFFLASLFALGGLVIESRHLSIAEFFLIPYLGMILIWPARQGIRFLLPFIPLYLMYLLVGVDSVSRLLKTASARATFLGVLSIVALVSYGLGLQMAVKQLDSLPDGPFTRQATELFSYVKKHTDPSAVFVFRKPRVLSLFTNRLATTYPYRDDGVSLAYFVDVGVNHVIVDLEDDEDKTWLVPLLARNPAVFHKMFENARFAILAFEGNGADRPAAADDATAALTATGTPTPTSPSATPFFPLGFMGPADEALFPQIAAAGFNVVYEFRSVQEIDEAEDYLRQAGAVGLQVIQNMPSCRAYESDDPLCDEFHAGVWSEAEWATFVSTLAAHDNLVAWYLPDEISDYAAAENLHTWVHTYDPLDRPVFANPGTWEQSVIALFPAFSEFIWTAAFPEHGGDPRAIVTYAMRRDANACRGTDTRWGAVLQFFDSAEFGESGGYPTAHELRADSYQAIIGGATGLWYFSYEMGRDLDRLWEAAVTIADEIVGSGRLDEVILSPEVPQTITKTILSGPVQSPLVHGEVYDSIQMLEKAHGGTHLFAVNIATDSVVVEFGNLPAGTREMQVLFEGRRIPVSDGSFRDSFVQDDVHIYRAISSVVFLPLVTKSPTNGFSHLYPVDVWKTG